MENPGDLAGVLGQSSLAPRSDTKEVGEKRSSDELGEKHEVARKRVKMRDLDDVIQSEEINSHHSKSLKNKEPNDKFRSDGEEMSQVTEVPLTLDLEASQVERTGKSTSQVVVDVAPGPLDLTSDDCIANRTDCDASPKCVENSDKLSSLHGKHSREPDNNCASTIRIGLDLNAEDVASSVNQYSFHPCKNRKHLNMRDASECASSTGSLEEKDSMRLWKEMKQNGFLSSSHGGISVQNSFLASSNGGISVQNSFLSSQGGMPPVPKQRGRKSKNDAQKKRMELAKRENVDRFTKIAAPSGLLNELNPGIINNVRNRKQVYSIIEAIVKSEKREKSLSESNQSSYLRSGSKDTDNFMAPANMSDSGIHRLIHSYEDRPSNTLCFSMQTSGSSMALNKSHPSISEGKSADGDSSMVDCEDDALALKLSSSNKASEYACTLSNEESTNFPSASSLSAKAASVASQWLELLHQDIKGRLSALHRSKKRVRAVISTELPFLISKEFSSGQENDPSVVNNCVAAAHMHRERWNTLFNQMDKALTEEEKQLESWFNQVKEMQLHCDQGLQYIHINAGYGFQHPGISEHDFSSGKVDSSQKELAVRAAAASIYSTCNFLASKENVSCC